MTSPLSAVWPQLLGWLLSRAVTMTGQFHWKAAPACSCEAAACGGPSGKGTQSPPWWAPRGHDLPGTWWELRRQLLSGRKEGGRGRGGALAGTRHPAPGTRRPRSAVSRGVSAPCLPGPVLPPWASPAAVTTPAPGAWCGLRGMTWPRAGLTLRHFRPRWAEVARGLGQASEPPRLAPVSRAGPRTPCS